MLQQKYSRSFIFALLVMMCAGSSAADFLYSGFGTIGYAQSDKPYYYNRFVNDKGTFNRDSVFGGQVDLKVVPQFSATVQVMIAPSLFEEEIWKTRLSWAFVSYRPADDWQIRLGKLRSPMYFSSESLNVGITYDFARMPSELYTFMSAQDFVGGDITKTIRTNAGEYSIDTFYARAKQTGRTYLRDDYSSIGAPPGETPGNVYSDTDITMLSLVGTALINENRFRIGAHRTKIKPHSPGAFALTIPYTEFAPGVGAYGLTMGESAPYVNQMTYAAGADVALGSGYRTIGEYLYSAPLSDTKQMSVAVQAFSLALLKEVGKFTPYVSYAQVKSPKWQREFYNTVNTNRVPSYIPGYAEMSSYQRALGDSLAVFDQHTYAIGSSYKITPKQKIKVEFARTFVGDNSNFVTAPAGEERGNRIINVFSASYNFVF